MTIIFDSACGIVARKMRMFAVLNARCWRKHLHSNIYPNTKTFSSLAAKSTPIVELRSYQLYPDQTSKYMKHTTKSAHLRKSLPLAFFGTPETGGTLNTALHLYHYAEGSAERNEKRKELAEKTEWQGYLSEVKACMMQQSSSIFVEAPIVDDFVEIKGLQYWVNSSNNDRSSSKGIIELRKYQLKLGYDTVPKFLKIYSSALPSKLNASGTHPDTELVTILVSDTGSLNQVYEVWKHGSETAMEQSRQASRTAKEWRSGIAQIAELAQTFDTSIINPTEFSPLR